jgi:hypothetical protein
MGDLENGIIACQRVAGSRFGTTVLVCDRHFMWHKNSGNAL